MLSDISLSGASRVDESDPRLIESSLSSQFASDDIINVSYESKSSLNQTNASANDSLLSTTNRMLSIIRINAKEIMSIGELKRVASSMFVAIYESLFNHKLSGIIRKPTTLADYSDNVQQVIDILGKQIDMDLGHISGKAIAEGDLRSISNLISIFKRIANITGSVSFFTF